MLSHDRHQLLHAADKVVYGILADLVREIPGATEDVGYLHFIMTDRLLVTGRHHANLLSILTSRCCRRPSWPALSA